jgi:translocon-associated protein subunit alpha
VCVEEVQIYPPRNQKNSENVLTSLKKLFVSELPAGNLVEFLVGFINKGNQDFILETVEASFRYPVDFSFYIQNFSTIAYNHAVKPNHEATLAYSFIPAEAFAGRPFGLSVNLNYRDSVRALDI